jgi:cytochrome P450
MTEDLAARFPVGATVQIEALERDPYPIYASLREREPISWIPSLRMYFVVSYRDVQQILQDDQRFVVGTERSTLFDTFGAHMLTVEGETHERHRRPHRAPFSGATIRARMEAQIRAHTDRLIDAFVDAHAVEIRGAFAARLPILTMLGLFGVPLEAEPQLRRWYDSFEAALANFTWDPQVRASAQANVTRFHELIQEGIDRARAGAEGASLLHELTRSPPPEGLSDEELRRNASIVFFGGISTVEALILNTLYAFSRHTQLLAAARTQTELIPRMIEETIRWMSPVQSATRHVAQDTTLAGVTFRAGDTVNCMLGAANRDPAVFPDPDRFEIARENLRRHLGFAAGPHHCLGLNLARAEATIAVARLLERLPNWQIDPAQSAEPTGFEFRQPRTLTLIDTQFRSTPA